VFDHLLVGLVVLLVLFKVKLKVSMEDSLFIGKILAFLDQELEIVFQFYIIDHE
jgi:hypothetical protein